MNSENKTPPDGPVKNGDIEPTMPPKEECPSHKTEPLPINNDTKSDTEVTSKNEDIFDDLAALGCSLEDVVPSEKLLTFLPVRKPKRDEWVFCHPEMTAPVNIYENKDTREAYLVLPAAVEALSDVVRHVRLTLSVNYAGTAFLWPVPVPTERQTHHSYISAFAAAEQAAKGWIRISWGLGDYEVFKRHKLGTEPVWPLEITCASEMLRFASKSGAFELIDSIEHPVVKRHLGLD